MAGGVRDGTEDDMSHHGREYEDEKCDWRCSDNANKLSSAVELIKAITNAGLNPTRSGGTAAHIRCDRWLEANGFECEATRRAQRERRAIELDTEIERLRKERGAL
jgi:hypothetical protein